VCPHDGALLLAPVADTLKRGPLPLSQATRIIERVCEMLEPIHGSGLTHGRLTPDNVFFRHVGSELSVRITEPDESRPLPAARYATPERARGEKEDPRADIYMLGVLLHHMISGAPPFDSGTEAALLKKHAEAEPQSLLALVLQDVPEPLDALLREMLAKTPSGRPQSVTDVKERLENIDLGSTITGVKLATLGVKDTDPGFTKDKSGGALLDEPTVETAHLFDTGQERVSANPTLLAVEKENQDDHPTSLEVDPYGDTVLRKRPDFAIVQDEGAADTRLRIAPMPPRELRDPRASSDETEPPGGPRTPLPPVALTKKPDPSPRGPTVRTELRSSQQMRLALLILIGVLVFVAGVLLVLLFTR
jgi:serine/threonine protein kinase